jgi:hypothetical protein
VKSTSIKGTGLIGATSFNSTSSSNGAAGVLGNDASAKGTFDAGVLGTTKVGIGVMGTAMSGTGVVGVATTGVAITARSTSGTGLAAFSTGYHAITAISTNGAGVNAFSSNGDGVVGSTNGGSPSNAGVLGSGNTTATAVRASGSGGLLFDGNNSHGVDVFQVNDSGQIIANDTVFGGQSGAASTGVTGQGTGVGVTGVGVGPGSTALSALGAADGQLLVAVNSNSTIVVRADDGGNLTIAGQIFTGGSCSTGCVVDPRKPGVHIVSYAPHEAEPTMEDAGEARLVDGTARVELDQPFASAIDHHHPYLVFITPEGDSRGLYVTDKSPAGFSVHENGGGRSTLPFDYRIVAKPFGAASPRLPKMMFSAQPRLLRVLDRPLNRPLPHVPKRG